MVEEGELVALKSSSPSKLFREIHFFICYKFSNYYILHNLLLG